MFKMATILGFGRVFKPEVVPEVESNSNIGHAIPYILKFQIQIQIQNSKVFIVTQILYIQETQRKA